MAALNDLYKTIIVIYLGLFSYILYQIIFYHQKKFLFTKTIFYFSLLAFIIIKIINNYSINIVSIYFIFYILGLVLANKLFYKKINNYNKSLNFFLLPFKKIIRIIIKLLIIPSFVYIIKDRYELHKFYKRYPYKKPISIYYLF